MPASEIGDALGLPAEQAVRGSQLGFDVYSMKPLSDAGVEVFTSEVAPVSQGGYAARGGAQQVMVTDRTKWTDPNAHKLGEIRGSL